MRGKGVRYDIIVPEVPKGMWTYDNTYEDGQYMIDGGVEAFSLLKSVMAILLSDPCKIIYLPTKRNKMLAPDLDYDAVLVRRELQFKQSEWFWIKKYLNHSHYVGKYSIRYHEGRLRTIADKINRREYYESKKYEIENKEMGNTIFFTLKKDLCFSYFGNICDAIEDHVDEEWPCYGGIGYCFTDEYLNDYLKSLEEFRRKYNI